METENDHHTIEMSELQTVNILSEMDIKMNTVHEPSIFYPCKRGVPSDHGAGFASLDLQPGIWLCGYLTATGIRR